MTWNAVAAGSGTLFGEISHAPCPAGHCQQARPLPRRALSTSQDDSTVTITDTVTFTIAW